MPVNPDPREVPEGGPIEYASRIYGATGSATVAHPRHSDAAGLQHYRCI